MLYVIVPHFVVNVVLNWSSSFTNIWFYLEYPCNKEKCSTPDTYCRICSIKGSECLYFRKALFKSLKSTQNLNYPFIFLIGTKFVNHQVCLIGKIVSLSMILKTSFCINGSNLGMIGLCFFLTGLAIGSNSMVYCASCQSKHLIYPYSH